MNPYYATPPQQQQPQQQRPPQVNLDDLFGGPSSPAVSANASSAAPPPPPPPSYDALGGSGYGGMAAARPDVYAAPPPPPVQPPQGYYGAPQPQPYAQPHAQPYVQPQPQPQPQPQLPYPAQAATPPQSHGHASPPASSQGGPGSPHAATAATPGGGEEDERAQLERIIRLRRELEEEQEREQRKKEELQTWGCTVCTFRNKLGVTQCEMCGTTRPGYAAPAPATAPAAAPAAPAASPASAPAPAARAGVTAWQCGMCLAPNEASAERCKVCYAYRSSGTPVATAGGGGGAATAGAPPSCTTRWRCSVCGEVNAPTSAHCRVCHGYQRNGTPVVGEVGGAAGGGAAPASAPGSGGDPPPPTSWSCSVCTFENPTTAAVCTACESGQRPWHLAPKRDKERRKEPASAGAATGGSVGSGKPRGEEKKAAATQWPCPTCTFLNGVGRKKCDMCGARRPEKYAAAADTAEARADARREAQDDEEEVAWQDDDSVTECNNCHTTFTFLTRRHHCRLCGYVFCAHCSGYALCLTEGGFPERVCVNCYKAKKDTLGSWRNDKTSALKGKLWVNR